MNKVLYERLPWAVRKCMVYNEEQWNGHSAEQQKVYLLDFHERFLDANDELIKLILESENGLAQ